MTKPLGEFIQPHDGQVERINDAELEASVSYFCTLVDDTLLSYADKVKVTEYTTLPNVASIQLVQLLDDDSRIYTSLETEETAIGSGMYERKIFIKQLDADDTMLSAHQYKFVPGALEITRTDSVPLLPEETILLHDDAYWQRQKELRDGLTYEELAEMAQALVKDMREAKILDKQMGFNHLPVRLEEIESLIEIARGSRPV